MGVGGKVQNKQRDGPMFPKKRVNGYEYRSPGGNI